MVATILAAITQVALNFEANLPNILPEDTNTDVGIFLDFGNVWGVDYDSSIDDSNKLRSTTGVALNGFLLWDQCLLYYLKTSLKRIQIKLSLLDLTWVLLFNIYEIYL